MEARSLSGIVAAGWMVAAAGAAHGFGGQIAAAEETGGGAGEAVRRGLRGIFSRD